VTRSTTPAASGLTPALIERCRLHLQDQRRLDIEALYLGYNAPPRTDSLGRPRGGRLFPRETPQDVDAAARWPVASHQGDAAYAASQTNGHCDCATACLCKGADKG
jgi:hypothetical protein